MIVSRTAYFAFARRAWIDSDKLVDADRNFFRRA